MVDRRSTFREISRTLSSLKGIPTLHLNVSKCNFVFLLVNQGEFSRASTPWTKALALQTIAGEKWSGCLPRG